MTEKAIQIKNYDLTQAKDMQTMAKVLKEHIIKHKLYTPIRGKNYVEVEGWQFAGGMLGVLPRVVKVEDLSNEKEIKWIAEVELFNLKTNTVVGRGFATCSNRESKKKDFDEYAVLSMAQTRAIGKAYRSSIGWVMKVAGYEATPTEEMDEVIDKKDIVDEVIEKIGRMRSIPALNTTAENIANSQKYNAEQKNQINKAIEEQKAKLSR